MVLDDASPQAGSYSAGNGTDYTRSQGPPGQNPALARYFPLKIKPEHVVQPDLFTLYFGFFGASNWKRVVSWALTERVENTWLLTNRGPTQDEMDAFTTCTTRSIYYRRMGVPLSSFLGTAYIYYQLRKDPIVPPKATPAQFFAGMRALAKVDWQGFRGLMAKQAFKMLFFTTTGAIVSGFAGTWSDTKSVLTDPRLRQFVEDMKGQKPEDIRRRKLEATNERIRRVRNGEQDIRRQVREGLGGNGGYDQGADQDPYSYGSTASVSSPAESDYSASQYSQQNDSADQSRSTSDASRRPQMYGGAPASRGMGNGQPSAGSDFFFGGSDDDASPTAPEYRHTNADGSPAGSAWERIRRQSGVPGPQQSSARSSRMQQWGQSQNAGDASNYSASQAQDRYDYDRSRERDQAQADFDKLMEAERNATNGPSRGRGWGS